MGMTSWKNRNVFVTGATGLLGSWLVQELLEQGAMLTCLIRDWVPSSKLIDSGLISRVNVVQGELESYPVLLRALNEYEIDTVFHLGAQTIVTIANRSPLSTFESNIKGTWTILEAARHCPTLRGIVVASSDKAYGEQSRLPYTEDACLTPLFPYDVSKACADLIARSYYHTFNLPVGITRCGNIYGGGDLNFNRVIPGTIFSLISDQPPIIRSNGSPIRDYFYVKDAVQAYLHLAQNLDRDEVKGQVFNFSACEPISVIDLVNKIITLFGVSHLQPQILTQEPLPGEIEQQYLSTQKAQETLNWKPGYTLEQGLQETIGWYRQFIRAKDKGKATACSGIQS